MSRSWHPRLQGRPRGEQAAIGLCVVGIRVRVNIRVGVRVRVIMRVGVRVRVILRVGVRVRVRVRVVVE